MRVRYGQASATSSSSQGLPKRKVREREKEKEKGKKEKKVRILRIPNRSLSVSDFPKGRKERHLVEETFTRRGISYNDYESFISCFFHPRREKTSCFCLALTHGRTNLCHNIPGDCCRFRLKNDTRFAQEIE